MAQPAFPATAPSVVPAATYDKWTYSFRMVGDGLTAPTGAAGPPVAGEVILQKYRVRGDGVMERSPLDGDTIRFGVADLYGTGNAQVNAALTALATAVQTIATQKGLL